MKQINVIAIALLAGGVFFSACNNKSGFGSGAPKLTNAKDSASYALGIMQAKGLKDNGADTLFDVKIMQSAMESVFRGDSVKMDQMQMQMMVQSYVSKEEGKKADVTLKAGEKFLAENKTKPGVKVTPSGLQYQVIKEGNGVKPLATDTVEVHYTGTLTNGKEFDSSQSHGGQPVTFPLNRVIPGWTEGIQLMSEGAKYKFFIPSNLAYGQQAPREIGPNAVLIFDVELLKVKKGK